MFSHSFSFATQKTNREEEGHRDQKRSKRNKKEKKKKEVSNKMRLKRIRGNGGEERKKKDGEWEFSRERGLIQRERGERAACC